MPEFSVVVPTFNRPERLRECLSALVQLQVEGEFEVIVVNDGGSDEAESVTRAFAHACPIRYVWQENTGPAGARNRGVRESQGTWIAFTDDDCLPDRAWLMALFHELRAEPSALVGGRIVNDLPANPWSSASQLIADLVYDFYNANPMACRFFSANNLALGRPLFDELGGFSTDFPRAAAEDRDICDRCRFLGRPMRYAPEAMVRHRHHLTLFRYCRQHFNYGRGAHCYHALRHARKSGHITEDLGFHRHLLALTRRRLRDYREHWPATLVAALLVWQVANAAGFFFEAAMASAKQGR